MLHSWQGELDDAGAEALASLMTSLRGAGAPDTTPATCRYVTPRFLADAYLVRLIHDCRRHASICFVRAASLGCSVVDHTAHSYSIQGAQPMRSMQKSMHRSLSQV